ncbi:MAG TPA: hypothetical protein VL307_12215 [Chitinophagaceae bacterium]|nr:hypothetical protein [Chitinophagaceae bacterium]
MCNCHRPRKLMLLLGIYCLLNSRLQAQSSSAAQDYEAITACTQRFYQYLNFSNGNTDAIDSIKEVCSLNASIIANFAGKPQQWTVTSFIEFLKEAVRKQNISRRQETELFEKTDLFGNIAQRFSTYSIQFTTTDKVEQRRGINAIQFVKVNGQWLISALLWDTEKPGTPIPGMYMRK